MEQFKITDYYKQRKTDRDIFQELIPFRVREILLIANLYDAYSISSEGQFFDQITGDFLQLNLYTAPRITTAKSEEEAMQKIDNYDYQIVIIMAGLNKQIPLEIAKKIKHNHPNLPILLLVNNNSDLRFFKGEWHKGNHIDRIFVWNGDSKVFLAMTKYVEDKLNVASDIETGNVRIILVVEDSVRYYTRYLPLLYTIVMQQTQRIINEHTVDELHKVLKMRARPKILLCSTYNQAIEIVDRYSDNLLTVISDVAFDKNGEKNENAGIDLITYIHKKIKIPCLLQSSNPDISSQAEMLGVDFLHKDSESLAFDIRNFVTTRCGFGDFVFKNSRGMEIDRARTLDEFEEKLHTISLESLLYHGKRQGISTWLMARGEITIAQKLRNLTVNDFESSGKLRQAILGIFQEVRMERLRGQAVQFDAKMLKNRRFILKMGAGSIGGKGRGLAFINHIIENIDFKRILPDINIAMPFTAIIGAEEFDLFIENNKLFNQIHIHQNFDYLKQRFAEAELTNNLQQKIREYVLHVENPLAIRSSGLFEDSLLQPFAGVYATYLLPNNHPDIEVRFDQLQTAIKMVYASIYAPQARDYFTAVNYKIEEERMAVIIQELIGEENHHRHYPHISGVAQSFNYYPFSYMKPSDGFSVAAIGLGKYVVGGEKSFRFCPKYPKLELLSIPDQLKNGQNYFYALDLSNNNVNLLQDGENSNIVKLKLAEAEEDGNLKHCAQVYDYHNQRLTNNFELKGTRVVNFANILQYEKYPLANTISIMLDFFEQAMGSPVEIEYAVDLNEAENGLPTFYPLQVKPLIQQTEAVDITLSNIANNNKIILSTKSMGNGKIVNISDIIYVDITQFDRTKTELIANEVALLNQKMERDDLDYILIGPGRWGTADKFTGIPVVWSQISHAKVIVEMGLENFPLDASLGSHFFHNLTAMNIGYLSIPYNSTDNELKYNLLENQTIVEQTHFLKHIRFEKPLTIIMDGKRQTAIVAL